MKTTRSISGLQRNIPSLGLARVAGKKTQRGLKCVYFKIPCHNNDAVKKRFFTSQVHTENSKEWKRKKHISYLGRHEQPTDTALLPPSHFFFRIQSLSSPSSGYLVVLISYHWSLFLLILLRCTTIFLYVVFLVVFFGGFLHSQRSTKVL